MNWPLPEEVSTEVNTTQTYLKMAITFLLPGLYVKKSLFRERTIPWPMALITESEVTDIMLLPAELIKIRVCCHCTLYLKKRQ